MNARILTLAALLLPGCVTLGQHEAEIDAERLRCAERRSQEMGTMADRHAAEMKRKDERIKYLEEGEFHNATPPDFEASPSPESMPYQQPMPTDGAE